MVPSQFVLSVAKIGRKGSNCSTLEKNKDKKEVFYKKVDKNRKKNETNKGRWRLKGSQNKNKKKNYPSRTIYKQDIVLKQEESP